jgi:hypothetical protein
MGAGISVEIDNPSLNSYVSQPQGLNMFGGLRIDFMLDSNAWSMQTGFNFWPSVGLGLTTQEYWMDGNVRFNCWRIDDDQGNTMFQSPDLTLTITQQISDMLSNGGGRARELKCIYVPTQP